MNVFKLKSPCKDCPFRTDVTPFLSPERVQGFKQDLIINDNHFHCHKTVKYGENDEGETHDVSNSQLCAGAMILQEKHGRPSVMARLGRVYGLYSPQKLDMVAPVYNSIDEMIEAYKDA